MPMKILYVEDNPVNLSLIQRIAQMNKHDLVSYDEAEIALAELEKGLAVDLILLDIQLAGEMDGIGLAKAIRQRGWKQPIIAITAYAMMGDKERILEAGCNEYLPKPLPIAEFLTLLAKYDPVNTGATPVLATPATPAPIAATPPPAPTPPAPAATVTPPPPPAEVGATATPSPAPVASLESSAPPVASPVIAAAPETVPATPAPTVNNSPS